MESRFNNIRIEYIKKELCTETSNLQYRCALELPYVSRPVNDCQKLNIFVPEAYFADESINGYDKDTAPVFFPNAVGGYMPGGLGMPEIKPDTKEPNTISRALEHGYVVVSPGVRGRGMKDAEGRNIGCAPAAILDLKAAVRFIRANRYQIPGNVERIVSNGTSAGGALSALLGTSGNHPDYEEFLMEMGAEKESDQIFAASCYCPITNLDHADMAYEWEFCGINEYHRRKFLPPEPGENHPNVVTEDGMMDEEQQKLSGELKELFPAYLNSLKLKDPDGGLLELDEDGNGSFKEYVASHVCASAQKELDRGADLSDQKWLSVENGRVKGIDFDGYVQFRTRMKATPAFDDLKNGSPENELFGTTEIRSRAFTEFGYTHAGKDAALADAMQVRMMNAMNYVGEAGAETAVHFRIRHGGIDRDTSLAISAMLAAKLQNHGIDVDFAYPWGIPHRGDYDLDEMFAWIDTICKGVRQ